jgi:hypothetical protein
MAVVSDGIDQRAAPKIDTALRAEGQLGPIIVPLRRLIMAIKLVNCAASY